MSKKVNEKGLASGKRCQAFFIGEGFKATVYQISIWLSSSSLTGEAVSRPGEIHRDASCQNAARDVRYILYTRYIYKENSYAHPT
jgi:hypothetical protein